MDCEIDKRRVSINLVIAYVLKEEFLMNKNNMNIREVICSCLESMGVIIDLSVLDGEDIDLTEYGLDSLAFISFVVDLEQQLDIIIPEEYLSFGALRSLNGFIGMISQIIEDDGLSLADSSS